MFPRFIPTPQPATGTATYNVLPYWDRLPGLPLQDALRLDVDIQPTGNTIPQNLVLELYNSTTSSWGFFSDANWGWSVPITDGSLINVTDVQLATAANPPWTKLRWRFKLYGIYGDPFGEENIT